MTATDFSLDGSLPAHGPITYDVIFVCVCTHVRVYCKLEMHPGHSMSNHQIFGHFSTDLLRFF